MKRTDRIKWKSPKAEQAPEVLVVSDVTELLKGTYACAFQLSAENSQQEVSLLFLISRNVSADMFSKN